MVDEDDGVPDAYPDEDGAPDGLGHLGHELVIERQRGQLVGAPGEDERPRSEVEAMLLLDEIAAREKPVGELLNGALRRVEDGCQLGQGHAARAQGHGVEDLDHSVDGAVRTRGHVVDASKPLRQRPDRVLTTDERFSTLPAVRISGSEYRTTYRRERARSPS